MLKSKSKKGFMDISFSWIFAILIGGFIIFGTVYGISKFSEIKGSSRSAESTVEFSNLLSALETGIESTKAGSIKFPIKTRLKNYCDSSGNFGYQEILTEEEVRGKWTKYGTEVSFENRYLFSPELEGKDFYVFSKPYSNPFRVANLIYITNADQKYCFVDVPEDIQEELNSTNQENFLFDCENMEDTIKVCFRTKTGCQIFVDLSRKYVEKERTKLNYDSEALMYAAIFSSSENYQCQVERLMKRTNSLNSIYKKKAVLSSCATELIPNLDSFENLLNSYLNLENLKEISLLSKSLKSSNKKLRCKLW